MGAGQFSCDSCGKTFAWKPQLAGKRVKCKCGAPMTVPASDPGADDAGLDDLAALAHGGDTYDDAPPPPPPPISGRGGRSGGAATARAPAVASSACPGCGMGVEPGAVICVNCGTNLKTGKKLSTAKVAASAGGGAAPAFDRPFGVRSVGDENKLSSKQKTILASIIGAILLGVVITVVIVTSKARAKEKERLAKLNAGPPPTLERVLIASERSGGLTEAMRDGTLYEELSKVKPPPRGQRRWSKELIDGMALAAGGEGKSFDARGWLEGDAQATFHGLSHDESLKLVTMLLDKYKCGAVQVVLEKESDKTSDVMIVTIPDHDVARGGTAPGPYREEFRKWADEFLKKLGDEQPPDFNQFYQVIRFKKGGADADEDDEDMDAEADEDEDTPARPANRKPRPKPGAAKPNPATPAAGATQGRPAQ